MIVCHICGRETEYHCEDCGEPVCEECCVPYTLQNQIDYTLCQVCHDGAQAERQLRYWKEQDEKEKKEKEKAAKLAARRIAARKRYWLPENVEKRRLKKLAEHERRAEQFAEAMRIVGEFFR